MARKTLAEIIGSETRYGRLSIEREAEPVFDGNGGLIRYAIAKCDCGNEVRARLSSLRSGAIVSCGCKRSEDAARLADKYSLKHGDARLGKRAPEYGIYRAMLNRCYNPNVERYPSYGGRGIKVCDAWRGDGGYEQFLVDVGPRISPTHSIDRINPDGDYEPLNVRWANAEVQANNKQSSALISAFGRQMTYAQASREFGVGQATLRYRIKNGLSPEEALTSRPKTGPYARTS